MGNYTIDDFKDRWTSPIVSDWKPPKHPKENTKAPTKEKAVRKEIKKPDEGSGQ